jgi:hypothetical protein
MCAPCTLKVHKRKIVFGSDYDFNTEKTQCFLFGPFWDAMRPIHLYAESGLAYTKNTK